MKDMTVKEMAAMGGHARAAILTKKRLSEIATTAINARWRKEKNNKKGQTQCKRKKTSKKKS